ncbi:MAG: hypothetical protein ACYCXF_00185 [Thermoleophilia bacterium]
MWLILLALVVVLTGGLLAFRARSADSNRVNNAEAVFEQWDQTVAETTELKARLNPAHDSYLALGGRLEQAVAGNDIAAIGRLVPEMRAGLNEQTRMLAELEAKINIRVNVAANMNAAINDLPQPPDIDRLRAVYNQAYQSDVLLSEALTGYYQQLQYGQEAVQLCSRYTQEQVSPAEFSARFSPDRARDANLGKVVWDKLGQATALDQDTLGASSYVT